MTEIKFEITGYIDWRKHNRKEIIKAKLNLFCVENGLELKEID